MSADVDRYVDHAARLIKRNGAWRIDNSETEASQGNAGEGDLVDCAGSLRLAKKLAREHAIELGWTGPFRWAAHPDYADWWDLTATNDANDEILDLDSDVRKED